MRFSVPAPESHHGVAALMSSRSYICFGNGYSVVKVQSPSLVKPWEALFMGYTRIFLKASTILGQRVPVWGEISGKIHDIFSVWIDPSIYSEF